MNKIILIGTLLFIGFCVIIAVDALKQLTELEDMQDRYQAKLNKITHKQK